MLGAYTEVRDILAQDPAYRPTSVFHSEDGRASGSAGLDLQCPD
jgi:hypothetical protein